MRSMIWKEINENFKWAMIPIAVFLGKFAIFGLPCMCGMLDMILVSLIAAVFGGVFGVLQFTFESQGDRRAHLIHRPMSPSMIFLAKVISGAGLYLFALGTPLVVYVILSSRPGIIAAPFQWLKLLPWMADIATGLSYYFAGVLAALRPGRWFGSRCLGYPAALLCSFLVWNVPEFWHAITVVSILCVIFAIAACGSFLSSDNDDRQPIVSKVALACTFFIGLSVLSVEGKIVVESMFFHNDNSLGVPDYVLDRSGRPLILQSRRGQKALVTDLNGNEVVDLLGQSIESQADLLRNVAFNAVGGNLIMRSYRIIGGAFVPYENKSSTPGEGWFYFPNRGRFFGYDLSSKQAVGSFGPDGFSNDDASQGQRFNGTLRLHRAIKGNFPQDPLAFSSGLYTVDFRRRNVTKLFIPASGELVRWARTYYEPYQGETPICVGTNRSTYLLHEDGRPFFKAPLVFDNETYGRTGVTLLENPERFVVWYTPSIHIGLVARETMPEHLVVYDANGEEHSRMTIPALTFPHSVLQPFLGAVTSFAEAAIIFGATSDEYFGYSTSSVSGKRVVRSCGSLCGLLFGPGSIEEDDWVPLSRELNGMAFSILPNPIDLSLGMRSNRIRLYLSLIFLNGVFGSLACFFFSRRYALSRINCFIWSVSGLLCGLLGLFVMFAVQDWPARIPCPYCRKLRLVTRDECEHCGVCHSLPTTDGTEIFESADSTLDNCSISA